MMTAHLTLEQKLATHTQSNSSFKPVVDSTPHVQAHDMSAEDFIREVIDEFTESGFEDIKRYVQRVGKIAVNPRAETRVLYAVMRWYSAQHDNRPINIEYKSSYGSMRFVADDKGLGIWLQLQDIDPAEAARHMSGQDQSATPAQEQTAKSTPNEIVKPVNQ